jgi:hypothetical protein
MGMHSSEPFMGKEAGHLVPCTSSSVRDRLRHFQVVIELNPRVTRSMMEIDARSQQKNMRAFLMDAHSAKVDTPALQEWSSPKFQSKRHSLTSLSLLF